MCPLCHLNLVDIDENLLEEAAVRTEQNILMEIDAKLTEKEKLRNIYKKKEEQEAKDKSGN